MIRVLVCALVLFIYLPSASAQPSLNWQLSNNAHWALSCDFVGNDLNSTRVPADQCSTACGNEPGCTHFAWTLHDGGTCWFKRDPSIKKSDANFNPEPSSMCGIMLSIRPSDPQPPVQDPEPPVQDPGPPAEDPRPEYRIFTRDLGEIVSTNEFSEENSGESECTDGPIAGIRCSDRYCDNKELIYVQPRSGPFFHNVIALWTEPVSEENPEGTQCPDGHLVDQIKCEKRYCDKISLRCAKVESGYRMDTTDLRTVSQFSEEEGKRLCDDGYYLWGLKCHGRFCDGLELKCARVDYEFTASMTIRQNRGLLYGPGTFDPSYGFTILKSPDLCVRRAGRDWMRLIEDDRPLNRMSIPGTHDSAARSAAVGACKNQKMTIFDQLDSGIRYLDVRLRRVTNTKFELPDEPLPDIKGPTIRATSEDKFALHHGPCYLNMNFDDLMVQVERFLISYPTETILMRVREEFEAFPNARPFGEIWEQYMARYGNLFVGDLKGEIPRLGDVRGKIVLLWDNPEIAGRGLPYLGDATDIQDFFQFRGSELDKKKDLIVEYLKKDKKKLVLNYVSGVLKPIPDPFFIAERLNPFTYRKIGEYTGRKDLGVVIMDYPSKELIYLILRHNF